MPGGEGGFQFPAAITPGGLAPRMGAAYSSNGQQLDPPVRGAGYEPSSYILEEPSDPLSLHNPLKKPGPLSSLPQKQSQI